MGKRKRKSTAKRNYGMSMNECERFIARRGEPPMLHPGEAAAVRRALRDAGDGPAGPWLSGGTAK